MFTVYEETKKIVSKIKGYLDQIFKLNSVKLHNILQKNTEMRFIIHKLFTYILSKYQI